MSDSHYEWVGAALQNDRAPERFLFVFSPNLEMLSLHREEEQRQIILVVVMDEDGVYLYIDLSE